MTLTWQHQVRSAIHLLEASHSDEAGPPRVFAGIDGFADEVVAVVDKRWGPGDAYSAIPTISAYAERLAGAAGKSANIEFVTLGVKIGGNGPQCADALGRLGARVDYAGSVGAGRVHPLFERLAAYGRIFPLAEPARTIAAEFEDGKIMYNRLESLHGLTFQGLVDAMGGAAALRGTLGWADLLAMLNWTMTPRMTEIWRGLIGAIQMTPPSRRPTFAFFDLCDPAKRSQDELHEAVEVIAEFSRCGITAILGLNEKESADVCAAFGVEYGEETPDGALARARRVSAATRIPEVVIHPVAYAAACGPSGEGSLPGPLCEHPRVTTGAGDHFNGGYCFGRLCGAPPETALALGKGVSGYYVRHGRGPSAEELAEFLRAWIDGSLDS